MTQTNPYADYAQAAADVLTQRWFTPDTPGRWVPNDFWRTPNVMTALNGLMELTGTDTYQSTLDNGLAAYLGVDQPGYYDDEAWWGAAFLRIHARTGREDYLSPVPPLFDDLRGGWDDTAGGGVWFKRQPPDYSDNDKNSISTVLFAEIAGRLHLTSSGTADQLAWAQRAWAWLRDHLVDRWGQLWGNALADGTIAPGNPPRPYGQGVAIAALTSLYQATGDARLLDAAVGLADAAVTSMTWEGGVLRDTGEVVGDFRPTLLDAILFKPILARYLGEFTVFLSQVAGRDQTARRYAAFLTANADALRASYPGGVFGMDWHTPQPDYRPATNPDGTDAKLYNGTLQSGAVDLFVAAARAASVLAGPGVESPTSTVRPYWIRGVELSVADSVGSAAAEIVGIELQNDLYGVDAIGFAPGDHVIDVGAHVGMFTLYVAKRHPQVTITAVEPDPVNFQLLQENLARNGVAGVRVLRRAVTADGRPFPLWRPGDNSGGAGGYYRETTGFSASVAPSCTLSELLDELGIDRCTLLKVDCEGAEHEILRDEAALARVEWLSAELHENQALRDRGWTVAALGSVIARHFAPTRLHLSTVEMGP